MAQVIAKMRPCCEHARFTQVENLHLTIVFLGETPSDKLSIIKEGMDSVNISPFSLYVGGFGYFHRKGGDIFWAGVERSKSLVTLHDQTYTQMKNHGFHLERRGFCPHLTLARQVLLKREYDHSAFVVPAIKMPVEKITLFQSQRQGGKLHYIPLYNKFLLKEKEI